MRTLLLFALGCTGTSPIPGKVGDTEDTGYEPFLVDRDEDGYPGWLSTADPAGADCDDNDPAVNPTNRRFVNAGPFTRGVDTFGPESDPAQTITLSDYCVDVTEVTNSAFAVFLDERAAAGHPNADDEGRPLYDFLDTDDEWDDEIPQWIVESGGHHSVSDGMDQHPVTEVYHWSGLAYCASRGGRLPTEAEWEKAARGPDDARLYPWGDEAPDCARANIRPGSLTMEPGGQLEEPCQPLTTPVGTYPDDLSPYGLHDLSGNVAEWVSDWYQVDYYEEAPTSDPQGPDSGEAEFPGGVVGPARLTRGGAFPTEPIWDTVFARYPEPADGTSNGVGFRCAYDPAP